MDAEGPNPFAPPVVDGGVPEAPGEVRPLRGQARVLLALLGGWAVMNALVFAAAARQLGLIARFAAGRYHEAEVFANAARMQLATFGRLVATVSLLAGFAALFVRATRNQRARGGEAGRWQRPGWIVAACFVPGLNLVAPFLVARTICRACSRGVRSLALVVWWVAFVTSVVLEALSRLHGGREVDLDDLLIATRLQVLAALVGFVAVAAAARFVHALAVVEDAR